MFRRWRKLFRPDLCTNIQVPARTEGNAERSRLRSPLDHLPIITSEALITAHAVTFLQSEIGHSLIGDRCRDDYARTDFDADM